MALEIHRRTALDGALWTWAIALPPVWLVAVLKSDDLPGQESNLWLLTPLALLAGFGVGGWIAGRRRPDTPLAHAVAAGAVAFGGIVAVAVLRRIVGGDEITLSYLVRLLLLAQICISAALLGGWVAARRAAPASS